MSEDKLKKELLYMVKLTSKYDFTKMEVVEGILRLENERQILESVFGKRFKARIFDIAAGQPTDSACVICSQHADNGVICNHCMETIGGSEYAKSQIKDKEENKLKKKFEFKRLRFHSNKEETSVKENQAKGIAIKAFQFAIIICLTLILFIQIWIFSLWRSIPDFNPMETARVSAYDEASVSSKEEAYEQIVLDFPAEEGYTVWFAREDAEYVGRFLLNPGDCCLEVEENLSDEERYDYFFKEDVYVFYISYLKEHTSKVGVAEINSDGAIIIEGSFNDGRRTDSFYKFR